MNVLEIQISVALVTRNRPESLNRCLKSLRSQSVQPFEVIVSDDSDLEYATATEAIAKQWDCQYIKGPKRGLYANRNHAAQACKGTHVRTMDDDHEFPEDHFQILEAVVKADPLSIWILGESHYDQIDSTTGIAHLPGEIQPRGFSQLPRDLDDTCAISDGATIYPRAIFSSHHYLELFKFGNLYLEFGARLKALGYRIRYCPKTYIIHHYIHDKRSFNDQKMQQQTAFLAALLTYGCYLPNFFKYVECLSYFSLIGLISTLKIKDYHFNIFDLWRLWIVGRKYQELFNKQNYAQII